MTEHKIYYTGVGARDTPAAYQLLMQTLAERLTRIGIVLRSGGADGADSAFEKGSHPDLKEIYLPWPKFNGSLSPLHYIHVDAYSIAAKYHPNWENLKQSVRKLHARNVHQVLGQNLVTPSTALICYTQDGASTAEDCTRLTGGTGMAIKIAHGIDIPIYNIQTREGYSSCIKWVVSLEKSNVQ